MVEQDIKTLSEQLARIERMTLIGAKNILTMDEASIITGYAKSYLYQLTSKRMIPHYRRDNRVFFKKDELEDWMTEQRVPTDNYYQSAAQSFVLQNPRYRH